MNGVIRYILRRRVCFSVVFVRQTTGGQCYRDTQPRVRLKTRSARFPTERRDAPAPIAHFRFSRTWSAAVFNVTDVAPKSVALLTIRFVGLRLYEHRLPIVPETVRPFPICPKSRTFGAHVMDVLYGYESPWYG